MKNLKFYHVLPEKDPLGGARNGSKVAIALRELEIPFEIISLDREQDLRRAGSEYLTKINPNGKVPAIKTDNIVLWESGAILLYLAQACPGGNLLPASPELNAKVVQWLFWEGTVFEPYLVAVFATSQASASDPVSFRGIPGGYVYAKSAGADIAAYEDALRQFDEQLQLLDRALEDTGFVAGEYSVADIALGCHVSTAFLAGVNISRHANIRKWLENLSTRPAWLADEIFPNDLEHGKLNHLI